MKKQILIFCGILILIIICLSLFYYFNNPTTKAYLLSFNGDIEIIRNGNSIEISEDMELNEKDKIITGGNGEATLVLFDSVVVDIDSNSEVELNSLINNNIKLTQTKGTTWNKFLSTFGVKSYEVETPNAVAIVRGTEFRVTASNSLTNLLTSEGKVEFMDKKNKKREYVLEGETLFFENGTLNKRELTREEQREVLMQKQRLLDNLKKIRVREINKKDALLDPIKRKFGITHEKTIDFIDKLDRGDASEEEILNKIPIKTNRVKKIMTYNEEARNIAIQIEKLNKTLINKELQDNVAPQTIKPKLTS